MGSVVAVVGTDTGIGKTWVGCALARGARAAGLEVRTVKLVETGTAAAIDPGEDGALLAVAAGQAAPLAALRRYRTAVAAAEAADRERVPFDLDVVIAETRAIAAEAELTLLEGAGGLLAPLTWERSLLDVLVALHAPAIVVAADRLGTINHTLLTVRELERFGVPVLAVALNAMGADDASVGSNAQALRRTAPALPVVETRAPGWTAELLRRIGGAR